MGKWFERGARTAAIIVAGHGGISAANPQVDATPVRAEAAIEQAAHIATNVGEAADDVSSADDVAKKAETVNDQLTSEADTYKSPEANPGGDDPQQVLLDLEGSREEERLNKSKEDVEAGNREEVSSGNITAPAPPATQEQPRAAPSADEQRSLVAAEADQQRAEADDEARQQAAARDEERPAEEAEPEEETWTEVDADVDDPDVD